MEVLLSASGLVKDYGAGRARRRVLDGASLELAAGELVAVVGRSGSGKSTLLHVLGGLDRPEAGRVEVAGRRLDLRRERAAAALRREQLGFVFQFFHLVPELSGRENVVLPARIAGRGARAARRADELIAALGLAGVADHLPHELSGGEQQRVAIARALINDPAVLLADEPTGNLDAVAGADVLARLRALARDRRAVLLVTHDPEAVRVADRVLELRDGRLVPAASAAPVDPPWSHRRAVR